MKVSVKKRREHANKALYEICQRLQQYYEAEMGGDGAAEPGAVGETTAAVLFGPTAIQTAYGASIAQLVRASDRFPESICGLLETAEQTGTPGRRWPP